MTPQEFFNTHNGKYLDFDGSFGNQCKDLFSFYNRDVVNNPKYVKGDAWSLYSTAPASYYTKVNTPQKGDVAIWKQYAFTNDPKQAFGHVAIVWDNGKFFSQNYPIGTKCSLQTIPTTKILGYLRPLIFNSMPDDSLDNHIIRTNGGRLAYVKAGTGKKQLITKENAGLALITFTQRLPKENVLPQQWINNVSDEKWNEYEEVPDGTWF